MNAKSRKFILKKLIPFIQREEGNGFAMCTWQHNVITCLPRQATFDSICPSIRNLEHCGTVGCIGGSCAALLKSSVACPYKACFIPKAIATALGLTKQEAYGLFMHWRPEEDAKYCWPTRYRRDFAKAKTPKSKAAVAVRLLRALTVHGGSILHNKQVARGAKWAA